MLKIGHDIPNNEETTLDELFEGELTLLQPKEKGGLRVNVDTILLASYTHIRNKDAVLELGCAHGAISLILAKRRELMNRRIAGSIVGIDIQARLVSLAKENAKRNKLEDFVSFLEGDLRAIKAILPPHSFDVVVMNPPYDQPGSSRISPSRPMATALHGVDCTLSEVVDAATYLLKDKGRLYLVMRSKRVGELIALMGNSNIPVKRMRCVHSKENEPAYVCLLEGMHHAGKEMVIEPPLFLRDGEHYTKQLKNAYKKALIGGVRCR